MIETIDITRCTGCGVCDIVCPADVIHMTDVAQMTHAAPSTDAKMMPNAGHAANVLADTEVPGLRTQKLLPVIRFREHCITCFNCEIFCPEKIVDVHPVVKSHPRAW